MVACLRLFPPLLLQGSLLPAFDVDSQHLNLFRNGSFTARHRQRKANSFGEVMSSERKNSLLHMTQGWDGIVT